MVRGRRFARGSSDEVGRLVIGCRSVSECVRVASRCGCQTGRAFRERLYESLPLRRRQAHGRTDGRRDRVLYPVRCLLVKVKPPIDDGTGRPRSLFDGR
uniref:Uncharacterized protein n=1 Tax=Peronospora matthiolae TaxID=2874970 RepID=A0AAV1T4F3_9STRA